MRSRYFVLVLAALAALVVTACAAPAASAPTTGTGAPAGETAVPGTGAPESPVATPGAGGLETVIGTQAAEWLAGELNVAASDVQLVSQEAAEWTDSCFGLGGPAESCAAVMTPGWRAIFEVDGKQYEVRSDQAAQYFRMVEVATS